MDTYKLEEILIKKKKELTQYENVISSKNKRTMGILLVFEAIVSLAFIIFGCVWLGDEYSSFVGLIFLILGIGLAVITIILLATVVRRITNAPSKIETLKRQIEALEKEKENSQKIIKNESSSGNLDDLVKLKKLLDMGGITEEEYEQKKKELL